MSLKILTAYCESKETLYDQSDNFHVTLSSYESKFGSIIIQIANLKDHLGDLENHFLGNDCLGEAAIVRSSWGQKASYLLKSMSK